LIVAHIQGSGEKHACNLRKWILDFVWVGELPFHRYGAASWSLLDHEDIKEAIQLHLQEHTKGGHITAKDVVEVVSTTELQSKSLSPGLQSHRFQKAPHIAGSQGSTGSMVDLKRACIWMGMSVKMLSAIVMLLSRGGRIMKSASTCGTMRIDHFHSQRVSLFLVLGVASTLSLSPMMNPFFIRMTCTNLAGLTRVISLPHNQKEMAKLSWSLTSSQLIGVAYVMVRVKAESLCKIFSDVCYGLTTPFEQRSQNSFQA
jgi:hypothetical protein